MRRSAAIAAIGFIVLAAFLLGTFQLSVYAWKPDTEVIVDSVRLD